MALHCNGFYNMVFPRNVMEELDIVLDHCRVSIPILKKTIGPFVLHFHTHGWKFETSKYLALLVRLHLAAKCAYMLRELNIVSDSDDEYREPSKR